MSDKNSFMVFSGTNSRYLAEKICQSLKCPLGNLLITKFSDGEFAVSYEESIRGRDVFLVQSTFPNSDNLMELLLTLNPTLSPGMASSSEVWCISTVLHSVVMLAGAKVTSIPGLRIPVSTLPQGTVPTPVIL